MTIIEKKSKPAGSKKGKTARRASSSILKVIEKTTPPRALKSKVKKTEDEPVPNIVTRKTVNKDNKKPSASVKKEDGISNKNILSKKRKITSVSKTVSESPIENKTSDSIPVKKSKKNLTIKKDNKKKVDATKKSEPIPKIKEENKNQIDSVKKSKKNLKIKKGKKNVESDTKEVKKIGNLEISKEHVKECVKAVFALSKKEKEGKKSLLSDESSPIILQIVAIKIPKTPHHNLRIMLPNSLVHSSDEVALLVPDLKKGLRQDYEKTVDHWETILREKNVTNIKEIIPMNRIKTEFRQYETIKKLARLFDFFLVDGRIAGHATHLLGKTFRKFARAPTPVKLHRDNLASEINNALKKTVLEIHGHGDSHSCFVATLNMSENDVAENILAAVEKIKKEYPGGINNIKSIFIKTRTSLAIPVYVSMKNRNLVPVPKVSAKRPKAFKDVEGELSTIESDVTVTVTPGGAVKIRKVPNKSEDDLGDEKVEDSSEAKIEKEEVEVENPSEVNVEKEDVKVEKKTDAIKTKKGKVNKKKIVSKKN